jgi:hypothetical protein
MDTTAKLHPLDFGKLRKDTWLEPDEIERAVLMRRDDRNFGLGVLRLREAIETQTGILTREDGERLRLMTDDEATVWSAREAARAGRRLERNAYRLTHVIDQSQLTARGLVLHDHAARVVTAMADAQRKERQKGATLFALLRGATPELEEPTP